VKKKFAAKKKKCNFHLGWRERKRGKLRYAHLGRGEKRLAGNNRRGKYAIKGKKDLWRGVDHEERKEASPVQQRHALNDLR